MQIWKRDIVTSNKFVPLYIFPYIFLEKACKEIFACLFAIAGFDLIDGRCYNLIAITENDRLDCSCMEEIK